MRDLNCANAELSQEVIDAAGGVSHAVARVIEISRQLWGLDRTPQHARDSPSRLHLVPTQSYDNVVSGLSDLHPFCARIFGWLHESNLVHRLQEKTGITHDVLRPVSLVRRCFVDVADHDLRAFAWRAVRAHYRCIPSGVETRRFFGMSKALNDWQPDPASRKVSEWRRKTQALLKELGDAIHATSEGLGDSEHRPAAESAALYSECCRMVGYIEPGWKSDLWIRTSHFDADFLLSGLFGMPTGIVGLDGLFGGGGISLPESIAGRKPSGRVILVKGRYGTGKSLLSLQLAAEVARKGGLVRMVPLEQSADDCRHMLETAGGVGNHGAVKLARVESDWIVAAELEKPVGDKGVVLILGSPAAKSNYQNLLKIIHEQSKDSIAYPLRLIVIDPMNSVVGFDSGDAAQRRADLLNVIEKLKAEGTHLLLVAEEAVEESDATNFIANVADTVIRLSVERRHAYDQRYIEIEKSRLQREQRGQHPFKIESGGGISISPSSAAIAARIRYRLRDQVGDPEVFGMPQFDKILGPRAFCRGDVLVFQGPGGTFKTHLGIMFLMGCGAAPETDEFPPANRKKLDRRKTTAALSLLLSARDEAASLRQMIRQPFAVRHLQSLPTRFSAKNILIVEARLSFIQPGAVFKILENEFDKAFAAGKRIDRVMIDNISHWEMACPFIREDETFGDTLVDFLRSRGATSLLICGDRPGHKDSVVQRSIIDNADVLVQTRRIPFRGTERVALDVQKTREMKHRAESFDVEIGRQGLELGTGSALLRVDPTGQVGHVKCVFYLHHENKIQKDYNLVIWDSFKPVLSREVTVNSKDRTHLIRAMRLNRFSTVDELQVLQLDEFQAPELLRGGDGVPALHVFPRSDWDQDEWGDLIEVVVQRNKDGSFAAIPFYENLGLMVYRTNSELLNDLNALDDWGRLADLCDRFHDRVFFGFPHERPENYNCLFIEVAQSLGAGPPTSGGPEAFQQWLEKEDLLKACLVYRRLCRAAHLQAIKNGSVKKRREESSPAAGPPAALSTAPTAPAGKPSTIPDIEPIVWRHWFTTLAGMMLKYSPAEQESFKVRPLPRGCAVAGEWYLAVPSYSAAPLVGLQVIKNLTSVSAEMERLRRGVGLPTRARFYNESAAELGSMPHWFDLPPAAVAKQMSTAFRRSSIGCYSTITQALTHHLKQIIELPDPEATPGTRQDEKLLKSVKVILSGLRKAVELLTPAHAASGRAKREQF